MNSAHLFTRSAATQINKSALWICVLGLGLSACGPKTSPKTPAAEEKTSALAVRALASSEVPLVGLEVLIQEKRDETQQRNLAALVHHQLQRAQVLLEKGASEPALELITGALLLLDQKSWINSGLLEQGEVLLQAADHAAKNGNAGRSQALYAMAESRVSSQVRKADAQNHLDALAAWTQSTKRTEPLIAAGNAARAAVEAAMVNPDAATYEAAKEKVVQWMTLGTQSTILDRGPKNSQERDEAIEAYRALRTGASSLLALSLRQRDLSDGLQTLRDAQLERTLPTRVESVVLAAAQEDETEAWRQLYGLYQGMQNQEDSEYSFQRNLAQAAVFQTSLALYRSAPDRMENALRLAQALNHLGLSEVASALLSRHAHPNCAPQTIERAMQLFSTGLIRLAESQQIKTARLSFKEAKPLLEVAQQPENREHGSAAAAAYGLLAEIELHAGNAREAQPLLEDALKLEGALKKGAPPFLYLRLAQVQWQQGDVPEAIASLNQGKKLASESGNDLFEAEVEELSFLIERENNKQFSPESAIGTAFHRVQWAVSARSYPAREFDAARLYARLLQYFDDPAQLANAYQAAFDISQTNQQKEIVLTEMARAAAMTLNISLARNATQAALSLNLDNEALLYIALWQRVAENLKDVKTDGQVLEVVNRTHVLKGWPQYLRQYLLGKLTDQQLFSASKNTIEKAEAQFYIATLSSEADQLPQRNLLQEVAKSPAIGLQEVRIARELLHPKRLSFSEFNSNKKK